MIPTFIRRLREFKAGCAAVGRRWLRLAVALVVGSMLLSVLAGRLACGARQSRGDDAAIAPVLHQLVLPALARELDTADAEQSLRRHDQVAALLDRLAPAPGRCADSADLVAARLDLAALMLEPATAASRSVVAQDLDRVQAALAAADCPRAALALLELRALQVQAQLALQEQRLTDADTALRLAQQHLMALENAVAVALPLQQRALEQHALAGELALAQQRLESALHHSQQLLARLNGAGASFASTVEAQHLAARGHELNGRVLAAQAQWLPAAAAFGSAAAVYAGLAEATGDRLRWRRLAALAAWNQAGSELQLGRWTAAAQALERALAHARHWQQLAPTDAQAVAFSVRVRTRQVEVLQAIDRLDQALTIALELADEARRRFAALRPSEQAAPPRQAALQDALRRVLALQRARGAAASACHWMLQLQSGDPALPPAIFASLVEHAENCGEGGSG